MGREHRHSRDLGNAEEVEVLNNENQDVSYAKDLSLENAILANFPDGCDRSFIVESKDEDSYEIIPKNLTFAEIINILNQAVKEEDYEKLDEIIQNIEEYESKSITLDIVNLKSFCEQQLNLDLQNRGDHQHIYSNILSRHKFDQEEFKCSYSVRELVLLAIAADDKLAEKYQDILFAEGNLSLLPLLTGGQKYIEVFTEKFHGIYNKIKDQTIQLVEPNKIGFFSIIALRKERELLKTVLVEHVLRNLEHVLKTSDPDPLYGVLETAPLVKNEKFIMIVLNAFERYVNEPTKDIQDLLKGSFVTLLETAISQEHLSIIECLCKRYINNKGSTSYDIYEQAFADDRVIKVLNQQILKNIGARDRKEIYDLVLKTAQDANNIKFIERLCKERPECSNDINENFKDEDNRIIDSLAENIGAGLKSFIADLPAEVDSDSFDVVPENAVFDLSHITESVKKAVNDKDVDALATHIGFFQARVTRVSPKEGLSVVEKILEIISDFVEGQGKVWNRYPTAPVVDLVYSAKQYYDGYISQADYEKVGNLKKNLYKIKSDLIKRSNNDHNEESRVKNVQDTSAMPNETQTSSQAVSREQLNNKESKNQQLRENVIDKGESIIASKKASEEAISNNYRRGKMPKNIEKKLSNAVDRINLTGLKHLLEKLEVSTCEPTVQKLLDQASNKMLSLKEDKQKKDLAPIIAFLKKKLEHTTAALPAGDNVGATASSQEIPVVELKESSPSLSSEEDDFSKLEGDKSDAFAGTSSDSNSNSPFEEINEESHEIRIPVIATVEPEATASASEMPSMITEKKPGNINDKKDDNYVSVSSAQGQDAQPEVLASELEIEDINNDITVNQSAGRVEQMANEDTQSELVVAAGIVSEIELDSPSLSSEDDKLRSNDSARISSDSPLFDMIDEAAVPETAAAMPSMVTEEKPDNINDEKDNSAASNSVNQDTSAQSSVIPENQNSLGNVGSTYAFEAQSVSDDEDDFCLTPVSVSRADEQGSKSNQKTTVPQNTKKYIVAASALAITGIALGVAVAVYLEMLAIGVAIAACCLVAATVTYCVRPQSLIEDNEIEDGVKKNVHCCG